MCIISDKHLDWTQGFCHMWLYGYILRCINTVDVLSVMKEFVQFKEGQYYNVYSWYYNDNSLIVKVVFKVVFNLHIYGQIHIHFI